MQTASDRGVALVLSAEEITKGKELTKLHDHFVEQLQIVKDVAACQAVTQSAPADVSMDGEGEEEEEVDEESEVLMKRPMWLRKSKQPAPKDDESNDRIVIHDPPCECCGKRNAECVGPEGLGCMECRNAKQVCSYSRSGRAKGKASVRRPMAASKVVSLRRSEPPITISKGEDMPSASCISKAKPVVSLPTRKRKLVDVEEEDFALADSGLRGDDLVMAGKLQSVYAKFRTIQGLMSDLANDLDMMRAHVNKKARY
ncbi:uncharacterized protein F5147DRAFT_771435 [Suillus discolor]|uniref:Zn(2)-C6 fungal-type domain-containing protein n=1 Tax=Suillus discolor TaxID=1912936 RepID=A0A9P7JWG6_9AGAM|nr:uncharacterized protein F5147DRAFT_771435 [Suillus discolor]KAG2112369.1 hypothetical protein F5147DRAFT_771435 [Suillus discolor]